MAAFRPRRRAGRRRVSMRVTAKVDYAVRAAVELASLEPDVPIKGDQLALAQDIPIKYLENILAEMQRSGLVRSRRGARGGYWLAKPPEAVTVAAIIRGTQGPPAQG